MKISTFLEVKAEQAENLDAFSGIKLLHIKKTVNKILSLVGKYEIFDQYTKHDISHINQLLEIAEWIIPIETKNRLTSADCLMMVLSIYFHDLGMLVTKDEYKNRNKSGFKDYKDKVITGEYGVDYKIKFNELLVQHEDTAEKYLYQEFVRSVHAKRINFWVQGIQNDELGLTPEIVTEINSLLHVLPAKFRIDIGKICESHHLNDLDDFEKYQISFPYGRTPDDAVNLHYSAIVLRTVDLLHITSDRTPTTEFRLINPTDPVSQIEWIKQMAVSNVRGKAKLINEEIVQSDTVEVYAYFDQPEKSDAFFSLIKYLSFAKKQLVDSFRWVQLATQKHGNTYFFPWKDINDDNVQTQGFERELFQFNLDQNKILNLLVGHTLYNDSTVVLRELIQNSIDAIRLYEYENKLETDNSIQINWNSKTKILEIIDSGTGMDREIIKDHLLKVGSSRYQDDKFKKDHPEFSPISRFGIGILTCFLISDEIEISTITNHDKEALNLSIKNVDGKYLLRNIQKSKLLNPIVNHGTQIFLKVRPEINLDNIHNDIKKWILFPPCQLNLKINEKENINIGFKSPKSAIEQYLCGLNYNLDDGKIKVEEKEKNGIVIAYALTYSKYLREWEFMYRIDNREDDLFNPIGTAVEGIRVEFDSPGFIGQRIIAVANATGKNAPKTNVSRSNIEAINQESNWLNTIYSIYVDFINDEIKKLYLEKGFSITWATMEAEFLLKPFSKSYNSNDKSDIKDLAILKSTINSINGLLIEVNKERNVTNVCKIIDINKICTIDCDLFRSAERMLKEVSYNASLGNLLEALYGNSNINFDPNQVILCGYNPNNILHKNAFENKEVTAIKLDRDNRRVDIVWSSTDKNKYWFKLNPIRNQKKQTEIFVQIEDLPIDGIEDEVAICVFHQYYLLKGSKYYDYVLKLRNELDIDSNQEHFKIFSYVLDLGL